MLAAGGVIGLLLMGTAISGLMAGTEGPAPRSDDDEPGPDDLPDADAQSAPSSSDALWTGDFAEDGSLTSAEVTDIPDTPLAQFLFGDGPEDATGSGEAIPGPANDTAQADTEAGAPAPGLGTGQAPLEDDSTSRAYPLEYDVLDTIPFAGGPDIPCVNGFDCNTDRLILDFDGTEQEAPTITIDLDASPGNAVVEANGIGVTLVEGTGDLTAGHVDVVMSGAPVAAPVVTALTDGGTLTDELDGRAQFDGNLVNTGGDAQTGGIGGDTLTGSIADETFFGNEGDDTLLGGAGSDALHGDEGDDALSGGEGDDFLAGGDGDDTLTGGAGGDLAFGGAGDDRIEGGAGHDALQGGPGADTILGGGGNDVIDGTFTSGLVFGDVDEDAGDVIDGGDGDDTIRVGSGDQVTGGEGRDTFIAGGDGAETGVLGTITDYDPEADQIEILYDPSVLSDPSVDVVDFTDGTGASILLDGAAILHVVGAQGLDPAQVVVRPTDALPAVAPQDV
jgi:Ca2+-binding RTX toxin-like protein